MMDEFRLNISEVGLQWLSATISNMMNIVSNI